ncbi:MAG: HlyC/CorC family transporter [Alphaproteobacteria bacterium]|nr:MAG: HlyC/CorC family transporter [Alphaproteobacteria bacterium]
MERWIDALDAWAARIGAALDPALLVQAAAIAGLLVLSAFFSGSETALTAASRAKLKARADQGSRAAALALRLTRDGESLIGAILLGNNLVNILAASLATALFTRLLGEAGVAVATLAMTVLVLVFAEVMPKTWAISDPERAALRVAPLIAVVIRLFAPVVAVVRGFVRGVLGLFGVRTDPERHVLALYEEIAGALELGVSEGAVEKEHRDRLLGALDLGQRTVEEIMLHRSEIEMINADESPRRIVEQCLESPYTRLPVWKGDPENIIGIIHAKELLRSLYRLWSRGGFSVDAFERFDLTDVLMPPYFIPETTPLDDQLREFIRRRTHFALVVDEYGALRGLVTLEDILEEIVGQIADETDVGTGEPQIETEDGGWVVDAMMTIRDFNRATGCNLPDEEANTLAGLVITEAQTIPTVGQVFSFHGFRFEVLGREENRITRLRIRPLEAEAPAPGA